MSIIEAPGIRAVTLAVGLCLGLTACATAAGEPEFPDVRMAYADIALDAPDAPARLARRIEATAADHCRRHAARLTPAHRRGQSDFCRDGVRAELVRALPPMVRAVHDQGRRARTAAGAP